MAVLIKIAAFGIGQGFDALLSAQERLQSVERGRRLACGIKLLRDLHIDECLDGRRLWFDLPQPLGRPAGVARPALA